MTMTTDREMTQAQKDILRPWADALADIYERIWEWVNDADDEHVAKLLDAAESTSETNCWWAINEVAKEVKVAARGRAMRRPEEGETAP